MKSITVKTSTNSSKALLTLCAYFGSLLALFLISNVVMATNDPQSLGGVAKSITDSMGNVAKLITAASYVAGVGFALMGMLKFKAHKDNPTQVSLSQPIVLLAIAAGLVFLPALIKSGGTTIFGAGAARATSSGGGLDDAAKKTD
jgi:intracellular multiplication protein IcmD